MHAFVGGGNRSAVPGLGSAVCCVRVWLGRACTEHCSVPRTRCNQYWMNELAGLFWWPWSLGAGLSFIMTTTHVTG